MFSPSSQDHGYSLQVFCLAHLVFLIICCSLCCSYLFNNLWVFLTFFFSKTLRQILLKHGVKLHLAGNPYPIREDCNIMETNFITYGFYSRTTIYWAMLKMFLNVILFKIARPADLLQNFMEAVKMIDMSCIVSNQTIQQFLK